MPPLSRAASAEQQHLIAGTALTIVATVLLVNFLWMVIVGAVWLFGIYAPQASSDAYFPPQAALFFVSFAFLVPGLILLPKGLKELKVYHAIQNAELLDQDPGRFLGDPRQALALRRGGLTLVRF
jgi:thiamine transporter ThiT